MCFLVKKHPSGSSVEVCHDIYMKTENMCVPDVLMLLKTYNTSKVPHPTLLKIV